MKDKHTSGGRNLMILCWMGLACQAVGVFLFIASVLNLKFGSPLGGPLFLTFGMALGGWAGNLREITGLKQRITDLEGREANTNEVT